MEFPVRRMIMQIRSARRHVERHAAAKWPSGDLAIGTLVAIHLKTRFERSMTSSSGTIETESRYSDICRSQHYVSVKKRGFARV
jgi:hypothetical protein